MSLVSDALKGIKENQKIKNCQSEIYSHSDNTVINAYGLILTKESGRIVKCEENIKTMTDAFLNNGKRMNKASASLGISQTRMRHWLMVNCPEFFEKYSYRTTREGINKHFDQLVLDVYKDQTTVRQLYNDCLKVYDLNINCDTFNLHLRNRFPGILKEIKERFAVPDRELYDKVWETLQIADRRRKQGLKHIPYSSYDWAKGMSKSRIDYITSRVRLLYASK